MKISRVPHYLKKVQQMGPLRAIEVISHRMHTSLFEQYSRYLAESKKAAHSWQTISQRHSIHDFDTYFKTLKKRSFSGAVDLYKKERADKDALVAQADAFAHDCFDILGSRQQCLMNLPWHSDFRLEYQNAQADYLFDKKQFYKDIVIQTGLTDRLIKDIKVPWELSRFQHLYVLGAAFEQTQEPLYSKAFVRQINDWISENPYLLGPNWVCPMDVGIRALNWVWAFHYFKDAPLVPKEFWPKFICSLYDHMTYLENNWEVYTITSNHYLSDLIGYFYLTWFFGDMSGMKKKRDWCYRELLKEFEKQVFDEGTDYESSTSYHKLVTEIYYHFYFLCQEFNLPLSHSFMTVFKKMFSFMEWCTPKGGQLVKIGDDDSGKILHYSVTQDMVDELKESDDTTEKHFEKFGLSVVKTDTWHATLRHHSFSLQQPSGHAHNDAGSITLAVGGKDVIVDPGSYLYTPSAVWRNKFRSVNVHNTFFIKDIEPVLFDDRSVFTLAIPEKQKSEPFISEHEQYGVVSKREMVFDQNNQTMTLIDTWSDLPEESVTGCWNFTLAPTIEPEFKDGMWHLKDANETVVTLKTHLKFSLIEGWYAPSYGVKVKTRRLWAERIISDESVEIVFVGKK